MSLPLQDRRFMDRAVALAERAEAAGNLPIGCLLVLDSRVIAEGANASLQPRFSPLRHAEIEALSVLDPQYLSRARDIICYTTLEPCAMCFSALVIHGVGRVVFGARDPNGGGHSLAPHLPPIYHRLHRVPEVAGPVLRATCDPLYERALARLIAARNAIERGPKLMSSS